MQTLSITAYNFDELSDKAKDKAREWMRNSGVCMDEWWDSTYEDAANVGIKITSFDTGRGQEIDGKVEDTESTAHRIVKDHGEGCETYKTAAAYLKERDEAIEAAPKDEDGETDTDALDEKLDELGEEFTRAILEDYLEILCDEWAYRLSDEAIDEDIRANDYLFTAEGSRTATLNA